MKINEIIQTNISRKNVGGVFSNDPHFDPKAINNGYFYNAYNIKDNPHEINKRTRRKTRNAGDVEGFAAYAKALVDNDMNGNNIYAPRIYNFKETVDAQGKSHYEFNVEMLENSKNVSANDAATAMESAFGSMDEFIRWKEHYSNKSDSYAISAEVGNMMEHMIHSGRMETDSEDLNEILRIIYNTQRSGLNREPKQMYTLDIHGGNIMYRRTSVGLQMVINDPLA